MHVVRLVANGIDGEDHLKDIDFTPSGIRTRWQAGYEHAQRILKASPWDRPVNPVEGIVIHDSLEDVSMPVAAGIDGFAGRTK
jgi:NTE family protein